MIYVNNRGLKRRQFRLCVVKKQCFTIFHDIQGAQVEFPPPKMTKIDLNLLESIFDKYGTMQKP